jgi:hypothetical protein
MVAPRTGDLALSFQLNGSSHVLMDEYLGRQTILLVFFRGHW